MELLKQLMGKGLFLTLHEDGVHLLVGSIHGLTDHQRQTIRSNRERLMDELRAHSGQYRNAESLPLPLLPEDARHVNGTLAYRPQESIHQLLTQYLEVWIQAAAEEPREQKKENAGRRAANSWLRECQH
jgi:hypothetical protein